MKGLNVYCKKCGVVTIPLDKIDDDIIYTYFKCPKCKQKIVVDLGLKDRKIKI
jgi:predicted Zn-ribbon and HTH transcriptional regulator